MTKTAVCTLFQGDYHFGLGALANSLYRHGYRGVLWAGYRGDLPPWADKLQRIDGSEESELVAAEGLAIRFVPVTTAAHMANYKPDFMMSVLDRLGAEWGGLCYIDPDIVIKNDWAYFQRWIGYGVALCEDVNSPLPATHPLRRHWQEIYAERGLALNATSDLYVNAGFVGVSRRDAPLLALWQKVQGIMADCIGGLSFANLAMAGGPDRANPFAKTDQDALNIALMAGWQSVSIAGKDAMDFIHGGYLMSHAIGPAKPWRKKMLRSALGGVPPSAPDKHFLDNLSAPIALYSSAALKWRRMDARLGAAVGRIMRRG